VAVLAAAGLGLALRLSPSAATSTLVGSSGDATRVAHEKFGDDAVYVLVRGDLTRMVLTEDLNRLVGVEGCLSGNVPSGVVAPGACGSLARLRAVQVVYGPGTFINSAVEQITAQLQAQTKSRAAQADRAAEAAKKLALADGKSRAQAQKLADGAARLVYAQFARDLIALNTKYGLNLTGAPRLNDPDFVYQLVFDPSRGARVPKARFAYLFPSPGSALISVRLKPGLSDAERTQAIALIRDAVRMPQWKLSGGATYVVTGAPVLADDLASTLAGSTLRLLVIAVIVMALVLVLLFRARLRLLPLAIALAACAIVFGGLSLLGLPLTMASIAVVPVLLGLVVDYAIQCQSGARVEAIATAALSTVAGFLVLLLSPVPMVRGFGALLIVGVGVGLGLALAVVRAAMAVPRSDGLAARSLRGAGEIVDASVRGVPQVFGRRRPRGNAPGPDSNAAGPFARLSARARDAVLRHPARVLGVALILAVGGWALETQTTVVSDLPSLVPQDLRAVRDLDALQRDTGVAGEVDVLVQANDLTDPKIVAWMRSYQSAVLRRHGYSAEHGCGRAALCPALSLPDLFRAPGSAATRAQVRALLDAVPNYISRAAITPDRKNAVLAFGIRLDSLENQRAVMQDMRKSLHPPAGVTARLAGLPVLAADANHALSDPLRRLGTTLLGLLAVFAALLAVYRSLERAWVPLVPIALATGWSALLLWVLGVSLNPLSAALSALVIAISTEFAVLLAARYRVEREAHDVAEALSRTYRSTGAAVLASGVTAIAGFAVLIASDIAMLRDFGLVTVVDLSVSLAGVLAVLPAVLVLAERRSVPALRGRRRRASVAA
jgi:hydrophobe/amphiphile efflux-3 (HAE3) family protein